MFAVWVELSCSDKEISFLCISPRLPPPAKKNVFPASAFSILLSTKSTFRSKSDSISFPFSPSQLGWQPRSDETKHARAFGLRNFRFIMAASLSEFCPGETFRLPKINKSISNHQRRNKQQESKNVSKLFFLKRKHRSETWKVSRNTNPPAAREMALTPRLPNLYENLFLLSLFRLRQIS